MKNIILNFLILFLLPFSAYADEYSTNKHKWEKCNFIELKTQKATDIRNIHGEKSLEEYLISKCGYRPIQKNRGYSFVAIQDCKVLYEHANKGECHKSDYSEYLEFFILELNPKVFNEQSYQDACEENKETSGDSYRKFIKFRKKACPAERL